MSTGAVPTSHQVSDDAATPSTAPFVDVLLQCALPSHAYPAVQWEACSALRMLCIAPVPVQLPAWASVSSLVNAHLQNVLRASIRAQSTSGRSNGGTSASLPEKVVNQAVRLAGDWMKALLLQPGPRENNPGMSSCASDTDTALAATGFVKLITQCAAQAGVPVLRSAAFAAIAAAPPVLWVTLESEQVQHVVVRVRRAATEDGVPATRAQAVNALQGIVADVASVAALGTELDEVVQALASACSDTSASVRGASAAALAALCTTLRDTAHDSCQDGTGDGSTAAAAVAGAPESCAFTSDRSKAPASTACLRTHAEGNVRDGVIAGGQCQHGPLTAAATANADAALHPESVAQVSVRCAGCGHAVGDLLQPSSWRALSTAALHVAKGGDKVRAHGVRAIGCLYSIVPVEQTRILPDLLNNSAGLQQLCDAHRESSRSGGGGDQELDTSDGAACNWPEWCSQAAGGVCQSMKQGNAKCAWNACIATAQMFSRWKQVKHLATESDMQAVHTAVVEQLHRSNNFKVRIHAAHAVQVAGPLSLPAGAGLEVLSAVMHALRALGADDTSQRLQGCAGSSADTSHKVAASPTKTSRGEGGERADEAPANFRYHAELTMRLTGVLVDFLSALPSTDAAAIAGDLGWIVEFLEEQIGLWSVGSTPQDTSGRTATPEPQVWSPFQGTVLTLTTFVMALPVVAADCIQPCLLVLHSFVFPLGCAACKRFSESESLCCAPLFGL